MSYSSPAPVTTPPFHDQLRDGRIDYLIFLDDGALLGADHRVTLRDKLSEFSDSTLELIEAAVEWNNEQPNPHLTSVIIGSNEHVVRESAFYRQRFCTSAYASHEIIIGLHSLDRYTSIGRLEELTGTELDIATAYLNVTAAIYEHVSDDTLELTQCIEMVEYQGEPAGYIKDPALQELIAAHYQKADAIISYIEARGSADTEALRDYLENDTALNDGVL